MNALLIGFEDKTPLLLQRLQDVSRATVIDPTGRLAPAAADRIDHDSVVYFDPTADHCVGLNLLDYPPQDVVALFQVLFPQGQSTLTRLYANVLLVNALAVVPVKDTILGVLKLLSDMAYRQACVQKATDPLVIAGWQFIDGWSEQQAGSARAFLFGMIQTLLLDPCIRPVLCQRTTFNGERVLIADLDRSRVGDLSAKLFGYLLMQRAGDVVINDLGFYNSDHVCGLLAQDRFTVTVDFLRQLTPALREQVLSIPEKIAVRASRDDARELLPYFGFDDTSGNIARITELEPDEAMLCSGKKLVVEIPKSLRRLNKVKRITKAKYSRPRSGINTAIAQFLDNSPSPGA